VAKALLIKQAKGTGQLPDRQRRTLKALGLRGINSEIVRSDTRAIRGMLNKVQSLIEAQQIDRTSYSRPKKALKKSGFKLG
jgi:large subunit ribosomal protein L30